MNQSNQLAPLLCAAMLMLSGCGEEINDSTRNTRVTSSAFEGIPFAPKADPDPFYSSVAPDPRLATGSILESRPITFTINGQAMPNEAWHLKFVTRNTSGKQIVGVATVVKPTIAAEGEAKLVSYQIAYNGLGANCTPSRNLSGNGEADNGATNYASYSTGLNTLGWTMVFPDFEGPYHAYASGKLSGQVTLDAIKAALAFEPLGLEPNTKTAMWGYSGGAIATAWASAIQPKYASEINIVGAVTGATPADLIGVARSADDQFFFGLVFSALIGINREFPSLFEGMLNEEGIRVANAIKDGCGGTPRDGSEGASGNISKYVKRSNFYNQPHVLELEKSISLPQGASSPRIPVFVYHEIFDEVIPVESSDKLVEAWCKDGTPVTYLKSATGEHLTGTLRFTGESLNFIESKLSGVPFLLAPTATQCN